MVVSKTFTELLKNQINKAPGSSSILVPLAKTTSLDANKNTVVSFVPETLSNSENSQDLLRESSMDCSTQNLGEKGPDPPDISGPGNRKNNGFKIRKKSTVSKASPYARLLMLGLKALC